MNIFYDIKNLRTALAPLKNNNIAYAFVPTMGNLHQGHLDLVHLAKKHTENVVVSIYVNPLQFGANEDLDSYPRTLEEDLEKLNKLEVTHVFVPSDEVMYPEGKESHTKVLVPDLGDDHCGKSRPQFFGGITTVVAKLFNIVQADYNVFGEKDYQQLAIIRKMVNDLQIPTKILSLPIVREKDGLAMSSRNNYLSSIERDIAPKLHATLRNMLDQIIKGKSFNDIEKESKEKLNKQGLTVDYLNICDANSLKIATNETQSIVILAAAALGKTRLIDNICLQLNR